MSKYFYFLIAFLFFGGCVHQLQTTPAPDWRTRSETIESLIKMNISLNTFDSTDVYRRNGLYYAARRNRGAFVYSPAEAKEQLLDSVVFIITPTTSYRWEFHKGQPNGSWVYLRRADKMMYLIENYHDGQLLKREKFKKGPILYEVETYHNGQFFKREAVNILPKN